MAFGGGRCYRVDDNCLLQPPALAGLWRAKHLRAETNRSWEEVTATYERPFSVSNNTSHQLRYNGTESDGSSSTRKLVAVDVKKTKYVNYGEFTEATFGQRRPGRTGEIQATRRGVRSRSVVAVGIAPGRYLGDRTT
ncbi:hypothetical protein EVAR_96521_1 [Eumeta japonica]|uniref:Uncharacterized protein n=1 Tax=Eumeta variegata TaxID=151549 RepID=A0A4C1WGD8_EUMVA|nr:hypothetical protein EVAR_96521_1 [Eumeta japonica]